MKKSRRARKADKEAQKQFIRTVERIEKKKDKLISDDVGVIEKIGVNGQRLSIWSHKDK